MSGQKTFWVVDWDKVQSVDDLKAILKACDPVFHPDFPGLEDIKSYCKHIDADGRQVPDREVDSDTEL